MPWVRYDDGFPSHPKVAEVKLRDRAALALHLLCSTRSSKTSTPGRVSEAVALEEAGSKARATKWARALVDSGLWHTAGHDCPRCPQIASGYVFHDWKDWNNYEELSRKRSAAGKKGAAARWGDDGTPHDNGMANAIAEPQQSHGNTSPKKWPDPDPDPEVLKGSVGDRLSHRYAREPEDDDMTIEESIIAAVHTSTGYKIPADHATRVAKQLLDGRQVRDPAAYVATAIHDRPWDFVPADMRSPAHGRTARDAIAATLRAAQGGDQP